MKICHVLSVCLTLTAINGSHKDNEAAKAVDSSLKCFHHQTTFCQYPLFHCFSELWILIKYVSFMMSHFFILIHYIIHVGSHCAFQISTSTVHCMKALKLICKRQRCCAQLCCLSTTVTYDMLCRASKEDITGNVTFYLNNVIDYSDQCCCVLFCFI